MTGWLEAFLVGPLRAIAASYEAAVVEVVSEPVLALAAGVVVAVVAGAFWFANQYEGGGSP